MKPIVVVGSINMDLVSRTERAPLPGETVFGTSFQMFSGGKGANQAVAVARLGYPVILLGKVGSDLFGDQLLQQLQNDGVNTASVERIEGSTGTASIVVDARGENSIIVTPGANLEVTPEYLANHQSVFAQAGMVLTQLEIPLDSVRRLAEICSQYGIPLMLDPAPAQLLDAATLEHVTWLTPNQTEASFYAGSDGETDFTLARIFATGVKNVILKRGDEGALLAEAGGGRTTVPAFSVQAVDTTAAGDSFNGAFAVALLRGLDLNDAARYAAAAAALSVTSPGAQSSLPTGSDVDHFLAASSHV